MPIKTFGTMGVDWEERVHFDRLREERLARIRAELQKSEIGALLCFDMANIRYITNTTIGTWAIDKLGRFCLLPQNDDPINWDFGIAAKHHEMYCSWFKEGYSRAGISTLRGAMPPGAHQAEDVARKIRISLEERGLHKEPLGVDVIELPVLFALQKEGIEEEELTGFLRDQVRAVHASWRHWPLVHGRLRRRSCSSSRYSARC